MFYICKCDFTILSQYIHPCFVIVFVITSRMELSYEFVLRLFVASLLGTVIGLEREYRAKEAGYRTHFLVALGSALIMIVSQHGFYEVLSHEGMGLDPSRIAAQVVTGIGFIGAGTIIINKQIVRGLTTAAGIWATSGIGLATGAGMYWLAVSATLLTLAGLELLSLFFKGIGLRSYAVEFTAHNSETLNALLDIFSSKNYIIISYQMTEKTVSGTTLYNVSMILKLKSEANNDDALLGIFNKYNDVTLHRIE